MYTLTVAHSIGAAEVLLAHVFFLDRSLLGVFGLSIVVFVLIANCSGIT